MINDYLKKIKKWYAFLNLREKLLFIGLCWALFYAIFSFLFFIPFDKRENDLTANIKQANDQIRDWKLQINMLNNIQETPLYKKWVKQEDYLNQQKQAYRTLLRSSANINWEDVIKSILLSDNTVVIEQIKNSPEELYTLPDIKTSVPIYQQKLLLGIYSNYFDTIKYIKKLQIALPTIHWNSLTYQVQKYPLAKVEMEFAVLYEKSA